MAWLASVAWTPKPRRASAAASIPVPQAASSTVLAGSIRRSRRAGAGALTA
jgi:hypothetical protein